MDYSTQISTSAADKGGECSSDECSPAAAVAPLWPGDDRVDWVFFNVFEKGKHDGSPKADFNTIVSAATEVLGSVTSHSKHCHCVAGKDRHCHGCDLASKPW